MCAICSLGVFYARMPATLRGGAQEASHELANLVQGSAEGPDLGSIFGATAARAVSNGRNVILQFTEASQFVDIRPLPGRLDPVRGGADWGPGPGPW